MASKGTGIRVVILDKQQKLASSVRSALIEPIRVFRHVTSCISYLDRQSKDETMIILLTTADDRRILEMFEGISSVETIFLLSTTNKSIDRLPMKVSNVYLQIETILRTLPETIFNLEHQLNGNSLTFHRQRGIRDNPKFYFYRLWKEQNGNSSKRFFVQQVRNLYRSFPNMKPLIDDFEKFYKSSSVLNWLDPIRHPFPYHLLINRALRTQNEPILSLVRFFLDDLTEQMRHGSAEASENEVFYGTKLSPSLANQLVKHRLADAVAFQCFLRCHKSRCDALRDAKRLTRRQDLVNALFKIELNHCRCVRLGDEYLIEMNTPFRIKYVTRSLSSNNNEPLLLVIKLIAMEDEENDHLYDLYRQRSEESKRKSARKSSPPPKVKDYEAIADKHMATKNWSKAVENLLQVTDPSVRVLNKLGCLYREHLNEIPNGLKYHQHALEKAQDRIRHETLTYLGKGYHQLKDYEGALKCYREALTFYENESEQDLVMIARCHVGIGNAQRALGNLDDALDHAEQALAIREHQIKPRNDFDVAACLGNIGNILHDQGDVHRGLSYAERAVDLLNSCGPGDVRLAAALNNLGAMYQSNDDPVKAREYFQLALKYLPDEKNPHCESTLENLAQLEAV